MEKQKVLVSIDVESPIGKDGVNKLIYGKTSSGEYGINRIMDILDHYSIKGLFFVDVAEAWEYGETVILQVMKDIEMRGHNVGLHLHPDRMADKNRRFLWQYTYEEQYELIKKALNLYKKALNHYPVSFRAGRYGANNDTIDIISKLGLKIDMSMYYGMKKRCHINGDYETVNQVKIINRVMEFPVTVFKSFDFLGYKRFDKIDESMPLGEFRHVVDKIALEKNVDVISFFMHSFSLLDWRAEPDNPKPIEANEKRIDDMIEYMLNNKCVFLTENKLLSIGYSANSNLLYTSCDFSTMKYSMIRAIKIMRDKFTRNI